ncbi:MAG: DegT/DnrJ/EryC1/StrS family aminotransferase [bacterium]
MSDELAIRGGPKAVTADVSEQWQRPVERQKELVGELIDEGFLSGCNQGVAKEFEDRFRDYVGCKFVLSTSHGHTALASAFFAGGIGAGDELITPTLGYIGGYAGALHAGATPVFCEADPQTLNMDAADAEKRITERTRVLLPVHQHGRPADLDALLELADKHELVVIEDAAHAHGSTWGGVRIGNLGHITCFSMQGCGPGGKPVTSGEGGIVATNDRELYERALIYCHLHRPGAVDELTNPVYRKLDSELVGWKWRAHPLAMALGLVSLESLDERLAKFAANREKLEEKLADVPGLDLIRNYPKATGCELYGGLQFLYDPEALGGLPAAAFVEACAAEGVPISGPKVDHIEHLRSLYTEGLPGLWGEGHAGPADLPLPRHQEGDFPVSEDLARRVLVMPGWIEAADGAVDQVAGAIKKVADGHEKLIEQVVVIGEARRERAGRTPF